MQKYKCLSMPTASHMTSWSTWTAQSHGTGLVWGFTVKQGGKTVYKDSGFHRVTTSSLTMEVEAVTHSIQWLAAQCDAQITHAIILTDSVNLLQKLESEVGCPDWHTAMHSLRLQRLLWIYCPGHARVSGNEWEDRLASTAYKLYHIWSAAWQGRGAQEAWGTFWTWAGHSIDRLRESGLEKGSSRHSTLQGQERYVFDLENIGIASRATLERLLRDGAEHVWAFPRAAMPSWAETDNPPFDRPYIWRSLFLISQFIVSKMVFLFRQHA